MLEAVLVGGASMFAVVERVARGRPAQRGRRARPARRARGSRVVAAETGGDRGRTIRVHVGTRQVTVREAGGAEPSCSPAARGGRGMSGPVLSPDAIAALVDAARDGRLPEEKPAPQRRRRMRAVDFTRPTKFTAEQERRLGRTLEAFCRTASTRLSAELRVPLELEVLTSHAADVGQRARARCPANSTAAIFDVEPIGTRMLLSTESTLLLGAIELLLGGSIDGGVKERRMTDIDQALGRHFFERAARAADADLDRRRRASTSRSRRSTSTWRPRRWSRCPSRRCRS